MEGTGFVSKQSHIRIAATKKTKQLYLFFKCDESGFTTYLYELTELEIRLLCQLMCPALTKQPLEGCQSALRIPDSDLLWH